MTTGIFTLRTYLTMYAPYLPTVPCEAHVRTIVNTTYHAHTHVDTNIPEALTLRVFLVMLHLPCLPRCKCLLVPLVCAVCAPISVSPSRPICESHAVGGPRVQADPGKIPGGSVTLLVTPCRRVVLLKGYFARAWNFGESW